MAGTTIGQNRCSEVDPTDRPFVVEWDATDNAMFESFAQRDVMFVRYEACELELLTGCTDDGLAGRYGAYNPPMWTSGSVEGFDVRDEYDLYAKLPLGASSLSGKIAGGATLSLQYFISGMVTATRSSIGHGDVADNPRCAEATHFVQAYNLGAFALSATEGNEQRVEGKHAGVGAGGGHSRSESRLRQGGDLASCTAEEAKELSRCQVPIRLVLRELEEGSATALSTPTSATAPAAPGGAAKTVKGATDLAALYDSAIRKSGTGDGGGCLRDLDRAKQIDGSDEKLHENLRAVCEMQSGRCGDGMKRYRKWMQRSAPTSAQGASNEDAAVISTAAMHCRGKGTPPVVRASQLSQEIAAAKRRPDNATCAGRGTKLLGVMGKLKTRDKIEEGQKAMSLSALSEAADCADAIGRCKDAKKLIAGYVKHSKISAKDHAATIAAMTKRLGRCGG